MKPKNASDKKLFSLPLHIYLIYLLVCTVLLTGVTFSHYITTTNGGDNANVAGGIIVVTSNSNTELIMEQPFDSSIVTQDFSFEVFNYSSNAISEVAIQYDVIVTLNEKLPDGVSLTMDGNDYSASDNNNKYTFSNAGTFEAGVQDSNTHTLSFTGDYSIINEQAERNITISIYAEQID